MLDARKVGSSWMLVDADWRATALLVSESDDEMGTSLLRGQTAMWRATALLVNDNDGMLGEGRRPCS